MAVLASPCSLLKDVPEAALGAILVLSPPACSTWASCDGSCALVGSSSPWPCSPSPWWCWSVSSRVWSAPPCLAWPTRTPLGPAPGRRAGPAPGTDHWIDPDLGRPTEQVPGVVVYLLYAPLWYGNAEYVVERVRRLLRSARVPLRNSVLDSNGMSDIDFTKLRPSGELVRGLKDEGVRVALAGRPIWCTTISSTLGVLGSYRRRPPLPQRGRGRSFLGAGHSAPGRGRSPRSGPKGHRSCPASPASPEPGPLPVRAMAAMLDGCRQRSSRASPDKTALTWPSCCSAKGYDVVGAPPQQHRNLRTHRPLIDKITLVSADLSTKRR